MMNTIARMAGYGTSAPAPAPERVTYDDSDDADMSEGSDNEGEDVVQVVDDAAAEAGFARASDDEDDDDEEENEGDEDSFNDATEGSNASSSSSALDAAVQERQAEMERAAAAAAAGALEASREAAAAARAEVERGAAEIAAAAAAVASAPPLPPASSSSPDRAAAAFERARATLGSGVELPPRGGGGANATDAPAAAAPAAPSSSAATTSASSAASSLVASLMRRVTGAETGSAPDAASAPAAAPSSSSSEAAPAPAAAAEAAAKAAAAASAPATSAWASSSLPWLPRRAAAPPAPAGEEAAAPSAAAAPAASAAAAAPAGGLTGLPPRPAALAPPASSSSTSSAPSSSSQEEAQQQAAPAPPRPAGGLGSLPPRPAGGLGALPPRGGGGGGGGGGGAPSAGAAASTPAASGSGGGGGAGAPSSSSSQSAATPASGASGASSAPAANGAPAAAGGSGGGGGGGGGGNGPVAAAAAATAAPAGDEPAEAAALRARIRAMVVLLFRLCLRLRQPPAAPIARNTLSKLAMAERIRLGSAPAGGGLDPQAAAVEAEKLEAARDGAGAREELPLNCTVLVLGPAGAGKTAMIRGLLREPSAVVDGAVAEGEGAPAAASSLPPCSPTKSVAIVSGKVAGCTLNFIDTPGLLRGPDGIRHNLRVLKAVRAAQAKHRPTIVLYVDRMDTPPRGGGAADAAMLKAVSDALGRAVWFNTILVLTHAASAPPDGDNGTPLPHDAFSQNRMHLLQQGVRAAAGDGRLFNPAALVDCHPRCRTDPETGDALLPSGAAWRPSLVMWCLASKLLADAEDVLHVGADKKKKGSANSAGESMQERIAAMMRGSRLPPIPHLLSKLNKGKSPVAKPDEDADVLPLAAIRKLRSPEQRTEELRRRRELVSKRREELGREGAGGGCPLYSPEPPLGPSFDEVPEHAHRYRDYDDAGSWITRPFVEPTPLDHDDGIDGVQAERTTMLRRRSALIDGVPVRVFGQFQKDKEKTTVHAEAEATLTHRLAEGILMDEAVAAAAKEKKRQKKLKKLSEARKRKGGGKGGGGDIDDFAPSTPDGSSASSSIPRAPLLGTVTTTVGVEGMTFQRDMLYTARAETKTNVPGLPAARAAVGVSASRLVEGGGAPTGQGPIAYGAKVDTRMGILQGAVDAGATLGAMTTATARGGRETATAGSTELNFASSSGGQYTVGGSFMNFRKDLGLQGNLGTQWEPTMRTVVAANATLNNKGAGGVTLRVTSNDKPRLGLVFLAPVLGSLWNAVASRRAAAAGGGGGELLDDGEGGEEDY